MKRQTGKYFHWNFLNCGKLFRMRKSHVRALLVWVSVFAAAAPTLIANHVPVEGPSHVAAPVPTYIIEAAHPPSAATPHHHADQRSRHLEQPQHSSPSQGSSGETCTLCAVCSGTAAPLPAAVSQADLNCSPPLKIMDVKFGETPVGMHFLSALRPRAPPLMVL
jgi:hypothetical protein